MKIEKQCKTLDLLEKKAKAKLNHSMSRWLIGASEFGFTEKNRVIFQGTTWEGGAAFIKYLTIKNHYVPSLSFS